ncbi:hypothetical protein PIB30_051863 [Stylosanthes scabra]|uniref:PB1 domain-containing protein n=1 Tax=Stylosanthes scabra TaxID=79078 RepID=A0ABU6SIQ8_9FABA|nr:hypothetical protein [Stylosanthes scabra]
MENLLKFKCSFGGQIRGHEGDHFSYDGGNHKMLHVRGDINFDCMTAELSNLFPGATVTSFKYLIPGDTLLITVDNDRDLRNLMREYNQHCGGSASPSPMRIFLDAANQGSAAVAPPASIPENASSNDDRGVKMEVEGQVEWKWVRFVGSASFSLPGPLTLLSFLFLLAALILLLLCIPIALLVVQNYSMAKAVAEIGNFELHHDNHRLIQLEKPIIQLPVPGTLVVPAKDDEYTIEMVLHDKKGSKIHASIPKVLVKKFCPVANIFQNGNIDCKELIDITISAEVVGNEGRQIVITLEDMEQGACSEQLLCIKASCEPLHNGRH